MLVKDDDRPQSWGELPQMGGNRLEPGTAGGRTNLEELHGARHRSMAPRLGSVLLVVLMLIDD